MYHGGSGSAIPFYIYIFHFRFSVLNLKVEVFGDHLYLGRVWTKFLVTIKNVFCPVLHLVPFATGIKNLSVQ